MDAKIVTPLLMTGIELSLPTVRGHKEEMNQY